MYHIAMLHGSLQSNTTHDTYAPFQLSELTDHDFDYWALGHIHRRNILKEKPPIVYPGNTQGRHRNERGEKGCYHVVLTSDQAEMTFIPLQALQFTEVRIDLAACSEINQLEHKIQDVIEKQYEKTTPQLIDLTLASDQQNLMEWKNNGYIAEILDVINEEFTGWNNWRYIFRYEVEVTSQTEDELWLEANHFIGELFRQFEELPMESHLNELYKHRQGRKYLDPLTNEEKTAIKEEARQLLIHELLVKGGK